MGSSTWAVPPHLLLPLLHPRWGHRGWLEIFSAPAVTAWPKSPPTQPDFVRQQAPIHLEQSEAPATALSLPPAPAQVSQWCG